MVYHIGYEYDIIGRLLDKDAVRQMSDKNINTSIIDEIYLENDDMLRNAKLAQMSLLVEIKNNEQMLSLEEEKKDPNRGIFHAIDEHVFNTETDRMRKELFIKKERLSELEEKIAVLEDRKQRLHEVKKMLLSDCPGNEETATMLLGKEKSLQLLLIQEQDRNRIAADLHDSTVQSMTALLHKVELIERFLDIDRTRAFVELSGMKDTIRGMIQEMREIIYDLRPMSLENLGLWMSVKEFLDLVQTRNQVQIQLDVDESALGRKLDDETEINLFRMIQEAVNNSAKHAQASLICVSAVVDGACLKIVISDDGIGIQEDRQDMNRSFGIRILQERANVLNAVLKISTGKSGTKIAIDLPLV